MRVCMSVSVWEHPTHRHSLCIYIRDGNVSVGHSHKRWKYLSFLVSWNQVEPNKYAFNQNKSSQINLDDVFMMLVCTLVSHLILILLATRMTLGGKLVLFSLPLSVSTRNIRRERYQFFMLSVNRFDLLKAHTQTRNDLKNRNPPWLMNRPLYCWL